MTSVARRFHLGHVPIDRVTFDGALAMIATMVRSGVGGAVFTPNVDHVVLAEDDERFRRAYEDVDLAVADGMPIVWASHMLGTKVPEKISGADLVPRLLERAEEKGWRVYLFGGAEGVAAKACERLRATRPRLSVVGFAASRIDMREPAEERRQIIEDIKRAAPDIVLVGLGAPKQELFIHEVMRALRPAVLFGVGASLDFLAGTVRRAPAWISAAGLEWAYRLASEPRRLWRRYLVRDPRFLRILVRDLFAERRGRTA